LKVLISIVKSKAPWDELIKAAKKDVPLINETKMKWKIWLENKEEGLLGGIYFFEDEEAFMKSMAEGKAKGVLPPLIETVYSQVIDVNEELSKLNKAPI
jgi:hypothetical protein